MNQCKKCGKMYDIRSGGQWGMCEGCFQALSFTDIARIMDDVE